MTLCEFKVQRCTPCNTDLRRARTDATGNPDRHTAMQTIDIQRRLDLLEITDETRHNIGVFRPVFETNLGVIVRRFYSHMNEYPECRAIFAGHKVDKVLRPRQHKHWLRLFSCHFDSGYVAGALRVGEAHFSNKIPPYIYLAGYNYFHCQLIRLAAENFENSLELQGLHTSIARLITLDTDLALTAYTRAFWSQRQQVA